MRTNLVKNYWSYRTSRFYSFSSDELGISSTDNKIFIPAKTMLLRFKNRSLLRGDEIAEANKGGENGMVIIIGGSAEEFGDAAVDNDKKP